MSEIETCDEVNAEQAAWMAEPNIANACEDERIAFRAGWEAGRDWARNEQARQDTSVGVTLKLLGCPHTPGCLTVGQCAGRSGQ